MKPWSIKNTLALTLITATLAACAPGGFQSSAVTLADDPTNEPASTGNSTQSTTSGSTDSASTAPSTSTSTGSSSGSSSSSVDIMTKYSYVDPTKIVPTGQLKTALTYYDANLSKIKNQDYLSVIDFRQYSGNKRFFIINMKTGAVWAIRVAHGKGSDPTHDGYAHTFSNVSGSNASSLGFYMTLSTYTGDNGYSLQLDGLSSTNSNAKSRSIVVHGADYVSEANVNQGRSWGCPAVAMENRTQLIDMIKGGSVIYASATEN